MPGAHATQGGYIRADYAVTNFGVRVIDAEPKVSASARRRVAVNVRLADAESLGQRINLHADLLNALALMQHRRQLRVRSCAEAD
jgi:hypothetical protein